MQHIYFNNSMYSWRRKPTKQSYTYQQNMNRAQPNGLAHRNIDKWQEHWFVAVADDGCSGPNNIRTIHAGKQQQLQNIENRNVPPKSRSNGIDSEAICEFFARSAGSKFSICFRWAVYECMQLARHTVAEPCTDTEERQVVRVVVPLSLLLSLSHLSSHTLSRH